MTGPKTYSKVRQKHILNRPLIRIKCIFLPKQLGESRLDPSETLDPSSGKDGLPVIKRKGNI